MTQQPYVSKDTLLNEIRKGYSDFDTLLSSLSEQQMMMAGNDGWTTKDHIAHLTSWQQRILPMLQAVMDNVELPDPTPDMTMDQINEQFRQRNAALPLDRVLADHRAVQQQMLKAVQAISEEDLNKPIFWLDDRPVVSEVIGNTYEHYEEHTHYIQQWLRGES
ncbi:MAG TPA: hypothetical protein DHW02_21715 [Ktedonobacter sp.]|nr:hypothetical protein [Ktedonobacter sp.]